MVWFAKMVSFRAEVVCNALREVWRLFLVPLAVGLLAGCAGVSGVGLSLPQGPAVVGHQPAKVQWHLPLPSSEVWGGQVRCSDTSGCRWVAVEHEVSAVVLYALSGRGQSLLDRQPVAYHPDSAKWIDDHHVVAALEKSRSLDIFAISADSKLRRVTQIEVGFEPRDVFVMSARDGGWLLLATPYRGQQVAWVHWRPGASSPRVALQAWCDTPWHVAMAPQGPRGQTAGLVTSCMDDNQVLYMPLPDTFDAAVAAQPQRVRRFEHVPRRVGVTPSGRYWYVALEVGGQVARYDVGSDTWQMLPFTAFGAVGVAPYDDDTVAWGENNRVLVVRYDAAGQLLAQRSWPVSGMPTELQWIDLDLDGHRDLISMNSTGPASDVLFGPLAP